MGLCLDSEIVKHGKGETVERNLEFIMAKMENQGGEPKDRRGSG